MCIPKFRAELHFFGTYLTKQLPPKNDANEQKKTLTTLGSPIYSTNTCLGAPVAMAGLWGCFFCTLATPQSNLIMENSKNPPTVRFFSIVRLDQHFFLTDLIFF